MKKKILIAIPNVNNNIDWRVIQAIDAQDFDREKFEILLLPLAGYGVSQTRTVAALTTIKENYDYLLFVDSDTILPQDFLKITLENAESKDISIISGWYYAKDLQNLHTHCVALNTELKEENKIKTFDMSQTEPMEVAAAAMGCCLIKKEVFAKLLFDEEPFRFTLGKSAEDMYFFLFWTSGIKKYVVPSLKCGHIATFII